MKLRTKFLVASILISAALTAASLLLVRAVVGAQGRAGLQQDLSNSVTMFTNLQRQREQSRLQAVRLIADLPIVRAMMASKDHKTIQNASGNIATLASSDLFVLADPQLAIMAVRGHLSSADEVSIYSQLQRSLADPKATSLWFNSGRLYEVSISPIYFGREDEGHVLGYLALGEEVNDSVIGELRQVANCEVAVFYRGTLLRSTLPPSQSSQLTSLNTDPQGSRQVNLDAERYLIRSVRLGSEPRADIVVLKSIDRADAALRSLSRMLLVTGLAAVGLGAILVFWISKTFTRPLHDLVSGVRALGRGEFDYPVATSGDDEVSELANVFSTMRTQLRTTQNNLVESEKLATIGRMASSISHDLRHHLVGILASAEFLADHRRSPQEKEELYQDVRTGVDGMNELVESLLEFSRTRAALRPSECDLREVIEHSIRSAKANPAYSNIPVEITVEGESNGNFDAKKLGRAFFNLLTNAFAAVSPETSPVRIAIKRADDSLEICVSDSGHGIPEDVVVHIFEPFYSFGKESGTGLGLSVAQKIVQDHGGDLWLHRTSPSGTEFRMVLPANRAASASVG